MKGWLSVSSFCFASSSEQQFSDPTEKGEKEYGHF